MSSLAAALLWCMPVPGGAEETVEAARAHFARAVALMDQGDPAQAVEEFERAYQARPRFAVLYNIGLAYVALERPVAAVRALERYLAEGGEQVPAERRAAVERELARQRSRTAALTITTDPPAASLAVDGEAVSADPAAAPLRVTAGAHRIRAALAGYRTAELELTLVGEEERQLHVVLATDPGDHPALGQLPIECPIPGVALVVDGTEVGRTPLGAPLLVTAGPHEVTCHHDGYEPLTRTVRVPAGGAAAVLRCRLPVSPALPPERAAELAVSPSEPDATVTIDGELAPATSRLPAGRHRVEVERPGFLSWSREVALEPGDRQSLDVHLVPSPAYAAERYRLARGHRVTAGALGGAGLGLGVATVVLAVWNQERFTDWERTQDDLDEAWAAGAPYPTDQRARQEANDELARSLHRYDAVTVGIGVGAAATTAGGVVLLVTGDAPARWHGLALHGTPDLAKIEWSTAW